MSITMEVDEEPVYGLDSNGRPDPAYAAGLGIVPAPTARRSLAFALDAVVWCVLALPMVFGLSQLVGVSLRASESASAPGLNDLLMPLILTAIGQLLLSIFGVVQLVLHGRKGVTLGKASFGIRSVNVATFERPGFWRIVLRALVLWGAQVVLALVGPALFFASGLWEPERRGRSWLDRVGRCWAIDARHGLDPFDGKALRHARRAADASNAVAEPNRLPSLATERPVDEHTFIPSARFSSGVISSAPEMLAELGQPGSEPGAWTPPPLIPHSKSSAEAKHESSSAAMFVFDDGTRVEASEPGLFGRDPAGTGAEAHWRLVPLDDPSMRISKTHVAFGIDGGAVWLEDRYSRNGTYVEFADGDGRLLAPGERTTVPIGATVHLGGRSFAVRTEESD